MDTHNAHTLDTHTHSQHTQLSLLCSPARTHAALFPFYTGQRVRIMGNDYVVGEKHDIAENKSVQRVCVMMGRYVEHLEGTCAQITDR